jgi:transcriptional regulator with XRE-family HTH domain
MKTEVKRKRFEEEYAEILKRWNSMTPTEQDQLCSQKPNSLSDEEKKLVGELSDAVYGHEDGQFMREELSKQTQSLRGLAQSIRDRLLQEMILERVGEVKLSKESSRRTFIKAFWSSLSLTVRNEIIAKRWEDLNSSEIIWMPMLLRLVYRMNEKAWNKTISMKRTLLISQLDIHVQEDEMARIIGSNLYQIRTKLARWTQTDIALLIGATQNVISRLENGQGGDLRSFYALMFVYSKHVELDNFFSSDYKVTLLSETDKELKAQNDLLKEYFGLIYRRGLETMRQLLSEQTNEMRRLLMGEEIQQEQINLQSWIQENTFTNEEIVVMQSALQHYKKSFIADKSITDSQG